ncbi:hypothetical protein COJ96_05965 [Bacillus sp. AFS073361]|uniref:hypothetical protein n=1 Tax=Bacillus sp. AFS073361 TaxID=2033511 RepID=UPI000BF83E6C|nr:hypothetical protein [Bacillus sp. AFS073361]PFP30256.1 hypothetical protein COJ96_05965 [Bacillus sp. AFS073361]
MARDFEINTSGLEALIQRSPQAASKGAKRGLHDSLDDWVVRSKDIAPLDKGTLRRGIKSEGVHGNGMRLVGEISSVAKERNFNYAYYIHEMNAGGKNVGGEKKYLDKSGEDNKDKWMRWVEEEIRNELQREGW